MDILTLLKKDHKEVKEMLSKLEKTTTRAAKTRLSLLKKLKAAVVLHEDIEESILYPRLKEYKLTRKSVMEAYQEHHFANVILAEVEKTDPESELWAAKFTVFQENLTHHIKEEETELFPKVRKVIDKVNLNAMGDEMLVLKKMAK